MNTHDLCIQLIQTTSWFWLLLYLNRLFFCYWEDELQRVKNLFSSSSSSYLQLKWFVKNLLREEKHKNVDKLFRLVVLCCLNFLIEFKQWLKEMSTLSKPTDEKPASEERKLRERNTRNSKWKQNKTFEKDIMLNRNYDNDTRLKWQTYNKRYFLITYYSWKNLKFVVLSFI